MKNTETIDPTQEMYLANLEVIVMPSGEVISMGKTLGQTKDFGKYLAPIESTNYKRMKMYAIIKDNIALLDDNTGTNLTQTILNDIKLLV